MTKNEASILIVEDDVNIRETMSTILQQNGYSTDTAENGYEAIQKTEAKFYNLALLDIKLPDMEALDRAYEKLAAGKDDVCQEKTTSPRGTSSETPSKT